MTTMVNGIAPPQGVEKKETEKNSYGDRILLQHPPTWRIPLKSHALGGKQPFVLSSMHHGTCFIVAHDSVWGRSFPTQTNKSLEKKKKKVNQLFPKKGSKQSTRNFLKCVLVCHLVGKHHHWCQDQIQGIIFTLTTFSSPTIKHTV